MCGNTWYFIESRFFFRSTIFLPAIFLSSVFFCVLKMKISQKRLYIAHPMQNALHTTNTIRKIAEQRMKSGEDFCINIIINAFKHKAQLCYRTNPLSKWICFVVTLFGQFDKRVQTDTLTHTEWEREGGERRINAEKERMCLRANEWINE